MMTKKLNPICLLFGTLLGLSILSCTDPDATEKLDPDQDFFTVDIDDNCQLSLPDYMIPDTALHTDALLAYRDEEDENFLVVLTWTEGEASELLIRNKVMNDSLGLAASFNEYQRWVMSEELKKPVSDTVTSEFIHTYPAALSTLQGSLNGVELHYRLLVIEAHETVYFILFWSSPEKKAKFENTFRQIMASFREIDKVEN